MKYKHYKKDFDYSYTFGIYPTIELLKYCPEKVREVFWHSKFKSEEASAIIDELCHKHDIEIVRNDSVIERVSVKGNVYMMGVFDKYESVLNKNNNHVVLVNPSDPGNLGTIMRTMLGFGYVDLAIIRPATDIFNPDVIRASMGAIFSINFGLFAGMDEYLGENTERAIYSLMTDGDKNLKDACFKKPGSLVFGSESSGLDKKYGESIYIEQSDQVDSLNLAVAVGIVLHGGKVKSKK